MRATLSDSCQQHPREARRNTLEKQEHTLASNTEEHMRKTGCAGRGRRRGEGRCHQATCCELFLRQGAGVAVPMRACSCLQAPATPVAKPTFRQPSLALSQRPLSTSPVPAVLSPPPSSGVRQTPSLYNATSLYMIECPLHDAVSIFCACACACAEDRERDRDGGGREKRPGNVALGTQIPGVCQHARLQVDLTQQSHP